MGAESNGLTLGQIAERVRLARSTVQRIVSALAAEHLLISASPTAGVKLGPAIVRLASSANIEIDHLVRPALDDLSDIIKETVDLSILKTDSAVFLYQIPGAHRLRAVSAVGESFPLHCTANGKAMLSLLSEESRSQVLAKGLRSFTEHTITNVDELRSQVQEYQKTRIAYDREEHTEGIVALGTAFADPLGRILAVSIPVPSARFHRIEAQLVTALRRTRRQIEGLLK